MPQQYYPGSIELIKTAFNNEIHGILEAKQTMKQSVTVQNSNSGTEVFYVESDSELNFSSDIPRDAEFPSDQILIERLNISPRKFGGKSRISWEDTIVVGPNLPMRTTRRMGNRIARLVDTQIWNQLSENQTPVRNKTLAAATAWDDGTRSNRIPQENLANAIAVIQNSQLQAYQPTNLFVNPLNAAYLRSNDYVLSSFDASGPELLSKGIMGLLYGLVVIQNPVITENYALVSDPREALIWAEVAGLTTDVVPHSGEFVEFIAYEYGNGALVAPGANCLITGI